MKSDFEFHELPKEHCSINRDDHDKLIQRIYSHFTFCYFNNDQVENDKKEELVHEYLLNKLKNTHFLTFSNFNISGTNNNINDDNSKASNIISNIVICSENKCLILKSIFKKSIIDYFSEQKTSFLNVTNPFDKSVQNKNDFQAIEEVREFSKTKKLKIMRNKFIKITFYPVLSFIIRRYFYPSNFFNDQSFFTFNEQINSNEQTLKEQILHFIDDDKTDFTSKFKQFKAILNKRSNEKNSIIPLIEFNSDDFVILRTIEINYCSIFYLVIHVESLHVLLMKKMKMNVETREIEFCQFLSKHPNEYFTRCYGYIKENEIINAILYQFMSNGSLDKFLKNKKYDDVFAFTTACRIFNGLFYLNKNSLVHRDLKPSNILIDHDGKAYISDFETIRLFQHSNLLNKEENFAESEFSADACSIIHSPPEQITSSAFNLSTDIYTYGEIIYFLFEKKDMFDHTLDNKDIIRRKKKNKIPKMETNFEFIENIYTSCVLAEYEKRSSIDKIESNLYLQFDSFSFLDQYYNFPLQSMIEYFTEMFNLILNFNIADQLENFINNHLFSFLFLNCFLDKEQNQYDLLFILGTFFYQGKFVDKNYHKVIKCFELSAKNNNLDAFLALGDLYYNGVIVDKNKHQAEYYYSVFTSKNNTINSPHLYFDYFYEFLSDIKLEYYLFKQHLIFSDELHNCYAFALIEYLYSEVYGVKDNFFEDEKKNEKIENICLLNKLRNSASFLFLGHILYYGKRNDPSYFSFKEYPKDLQFFDLEKDNDQYPEFLNTKGYFYYNGILFEPDEQKAKYYYELAEKKDNPNACLNLGNIYYKNDFNRSKYYFEKAAKSGNSYAYLYLANLYFKRKTTDDYIKSREYTKKSAELNNPNAINLLGFMYYRGLGGKQDNMRAKHYYELALQQDYAYSASNLGFFYRKGIGVQQNYLKSMQHYEIASKQFITNALYQVGTYSFNGEGVDMDIEKAIRIFKTIVKVYEEKVLMIFIRQYYILKNSAFKLDRMAFLAYNDLGVIHTIESQFFDKEKAQDYFIESGFSEYVHGQNNYALFYQFFLDKKENAIYLYNKAASKNFALSLYNLGYLNEIDGNVEESIKFYTKASKHEDDPILLYDENIFDNRLEISKTFIICMTNLNLVLYYLSKSNIILAKSFFVQTFNQLCKKYDELKCVFEIKDQTEYKFQFDFIIDKKQSIFAYLKYFIFNYPLFNLKNQKNLDSIQLPPFSINKKSNLKSASILNQFESIIKKIQSNLKQQDKESLKKKELNDEILDDIENKNFDEGIFNDLGFLFDFAISPELINIFIEEIKEIVTYMKKIIYTHPYPILFGRIWLHQPSEKGEELNKSFYDGFGI